MNLCEHCICLYTVCSTVLFIWIEHLVRLLILSWYVARPNKEGCTPSTCRFARHDKHSILSDHKKK